MRIFATIIPALIVAISFSVISTAHAGKSVRRGAVYCQGDHLHYGTGDAFASKKQAFKDAVSSWAGFTMFEYGNEWGNWNNSINRAVDCKKSGGLWKCSIQSTPCRKATRQDRYKK